MCLLWIFHQCELNNIRVIGRPMNYLHLPTWLSAFIYFEHVSSLMRYRSYNCICSQLWDFLVPRTIDYKWGMSNDSCWLLHLVQCGSIVTLFIWFFKIIQPKMIKIGKVGTSVPLTCQIILYLVSFVKPPLFIHDITRFKITNRPYFCRITGWGRQLIFYIFLDSAFCWLTSSIVSILSKCFRLLPWTD